MREELRGRNLSFTEIAKLVGENWQNLTAAEKEPFESTAQAIKDKYLSELAEYKKTPQYRQYQSYLQEFKAKHASPSQGEYKCALRTRSIFAPALTTITGNCRQRCLQKSQALRVWCSRPR
jgi:hypothetical protein